MSPDHAFSPLAPHPALRMLASVWARAIGRRSEVSVALPGADSSLEATLRSATMPSRRRNEPARPTVPGALSAQPVLKAHRDALTGLSTPDHLADTGETWSSELHRSGLSACVLRVGLEGFDTVVDRYGRLAGDQVLVQVAKRLRQLARAEDRVMRVAAAEFVLMLGCPGDDVQAFSRAIAARVVAELQRPMSYRTVSHLPVGCCVGSALWPANGATLEAVLGRAEEALAWARRSGRGQIRQFANVEEAIAA